VSLAGLPARPTGGPSYSTQVAEPVVCRLLRFVRQPPRFFADRSERSYVEKHREPVKLLITTTGGNEPQFGNKSSGVTTVAGLQAWPGGATGLRSQGPPLQTDGTRTCASRTCSELSPWHMRLHAGETLADARGRRGRTWPRRALC